MRTNRRTVCFAATLAILASGLGAMAETDHPPAPPHRGFQKDGGRGGDMDRGQRALERFMERLRRQEPEEFERLQRLREKDDPAFRAELRKRLAQKRKRLYGHRRGGGGPDAAMPNRGRNLGDKSPKGICGAQSRREDPEVAKLRKSIGTLASRFRQAEDEEQARIASDLKADLGRMFDIKQKERLETVRRLEAKIGELKRIIEERDNDREKIIERQFQHITLDSAVEKD